MALSAGAETKATKGVARGEDTKLQAIYHAEWQWRLKLREEDEDQPQRVKAHLPKVDAATQHAKLLHWQGVMKQLDGVKAAGLSPKEHLNYEVFREQIAVLLEGQRFREFERPVNSDSAFWSGEESVAREVFRRPEDYTNYVSQLNGLPRYFADQMANMRAGLQRGFTPPRVTLEGRDGSIRGTAEATAAEKTLYWKPMENLPASMPEAEKTKLRGEAKAAIEDKVIPAYAELLKFWTEEYVPGTVTSLAAEDLPDGKAYYQSKIREFATVNMSPEEIHEIGLSKMASIHAEMLEQMKAAKFDGSFAEFLQFLRSDPQFYAKTPEELLLRAAGISKEFDAVSGRYFGYLPRQRFAIKPVPAEIAPFYTSARGGAGVYLVNTYDLPSRGLYSLPALTLHESAPGHAFQIPIATEVVKAQALPKFRTAYISAYGEGWALYCERLGTEMGMYHNAYERFGMLSYQAWRAARLVVDTGVHAQGWTRAQAQQYLRDNTALSDHEIETEVDRYISWPAQALSYYLGEMEIVKERRKAEAVLGAKFNVRAFHDAVLETGSVPLPLLEQHLDAWIAGGGVGPYVDMEK
jgi:uncharacterized protein (DUF885 family)